MRSALPTGLLMLVLAAGCWEEPPVPSSPGRDPAAERAAGVPAWVPSITPQQAALLAPVERAVKAPAARVFPDLTRFGYANNVPLAAPADAVKFTRMVDQVLDDSPRFYALVDLSPGAANPVVQYGPAPLEPDGYQIAKRDDSGAAQLVPATGAEEARAAVAQGEKQAGAGDLSGAIEVYRAALGRTPSVPALRFALAAALAQAGRVADAELAYRGVVALDPTFAPAHLALAEIAEGRHDRAAARRALVEALAYHPPSPRGLALLRKLADRAPAKAADGGWYDAPAPSATGDASVSLAGARVEPFALFLDVDAAGAVHVATRKGDAAARTYGGCRAVMRHEPELRAQIFKQPRETPYYLSVAEEVVCLEAGLGAYLSTTRGMKTEPALEQLLRIAGEDGLSGYVMFEILGQHRPERARVAPSDVHRETVAYLERWVLELRRETIPEGVFTAKR
jgi:tetratricopeptide (TPR) repeat protein